MNASGVRIEVGVLLNCTTLRVTVRPDYWPYSLHVTYRDTESDWFDTFPIGPLDGTFTDPFGGTRFVVETVDVYVAYDGVVSATIPDACLDGEAAIGR